MTEEIPFEDAVVEVENVSKRLALLHLAYAKTLTEELGEEEGKRLVLKAIKRYGKEIGKKRREDIDKKGLEPTPENFSKGESLSIPSFGMHSKIERRENLRTYGCVMGELWREYGEEELGALYCYVDPAKYMGYNENYIQKHVKTISKGDDFCEFVVEHSTEEEREAFHSDSKDFSDVDDYLK